MSESETAENEEPDNNENEENEAIDFDSLSEEQREKLATHPQVRKMLEYEDSQVATISPMLENFLNNEETEDTAELLIEGIAERRGRITTQTVRKVLTGFFEEYNSVRE